MSNAVKLAIAIAVGLLVLVAGYMIFASRSERTLEMAYGAFAAKDNDTALRLLNGLVDKMAPDRVQMYLGYVYRAKQQWQQSDQAFAQAERAAKQHLQPTLMLEIYLNEALNGYLQGREDQLEHAITKADELNEENAWLEFFKGLEAFQREKYGVAMEIWKSLDQLIPLSNWMRQAFDHIFTPQWLTIHLVRCQIETGHFQLARQMLEEEMRRQPLEDAEILNFLMGLSYIREANSKPFNSATPDYKLAVSYFDRLSPGNVDFAKERPRLVSYVIKTMQKLVTSNDLNELPFYASVLDHWGAREELTGLVQQLVDAFNEALQQGNVNQIKALVSLLQQMALNETVRQNLQKMLQEFATRSLDDNDLPKAMRLWELSQGFSQDPTQASRVFSNKIASQILTMLGPDDNTLKNSTPYVIFWMKVEQDGAVRLAFANRLLNVAAETLQTERNTRKALAIYSLALAIPTGNGQLAVRREVVARLSELYSKALEEDDVQKLRTLFLVIQALDLKEVDVQRQKEIPKQLAAAESFLSQGNYDEAIRRARWVATLDPNNQTARLIAGRVLYWQANYAKALHYLSGVTAPDLELLEAIAVSQILSGSEKEGTILLDSIQKKRPLRPESIERLGFGLMAAGRYAEGAAWLKQIPSPDDEVLAGLAYSELRQQNPTEAQAILSRISPATSDLENIQGMIIRTEVAMNQTEPAEQRLQSLLARREEPNLGTLPPAFYQFYRTVLRPFNRFAIAGYFFKEVKHQNDIALKYLNTVKDPSPETRLLKGKVLMALGRPVEAVSEFRQAYSESLDPHVKVEVMPLLAQALTASGQWIEAFGWYRRFFDEHSDMLEHREDYAQLLMTLRRYDLANKQFALLESKKRLSPAQTVAYINSLVGNGQFDEAGRIGEQALGEHSPLNLAQKLMVARAMVIANHQESTWPILKQLPPVEQLSSEEAVALLDFLMEMGSYAQAISLATDREALLSRSPSGLLAVAKLYLRLDQVAEALKLADAAKALDPNNSAVLEFIATHVTDLQILQQQLDQWRAAAQGKEPPPTVVISFARAVAALSHRRPPKELVPEPLRLDQRRALDLLSALNKSQPDIPEVLDLIGEMQALLNNSPAAIEFFVNAARLSPSYSNALLQLARQYELQKDAKHAVAALYQVTTYEPDNADAWEALAHLYRLEGDLYEASIFYQNAIQFRPNKIDSYLALAKIFLDLRTPEDAQKILSRAAKIQSDNVAVQKLLLQTLYDSALETTADDPSQLRAEREAAAQTLRRLAPNEAEQFLSELKKQSHYSDIP